MCDNVSCVVSGPEEDYDIPNSSLGKIIFDSLMKRDLNDVINIDGFTGNVLACEDLLKESIKFTHVFKNLGIVKDDVVSIVSENTINYCVPLLAAFYMGVVVNPINPNHKEGELKHGFLISKPKLVLCSEGALATVLQIKDELKFIQTVLRMGSNDYGKGIANVPEITCADVHNFKPDQLDPLTQRALILTSSGTTGLPKGVLLTHRNLREVLGCFSHPKYGNVSAQDTAVAMLPFFHIFGLTIQLLAMTVPMKTVVMAKFKPEVFLKSIQSYKVTKLITVPPVLLFLVKSNLVDNYDISSIKDIIFGGASISDEFQEEIVKKLGMATVRQAYGLTETSGICTFTTTDSKKTGTVGVLVPSCVAKVWDPISNKNVGPLKIGEICSKGPMFMQGYMENKSATQVCIDDAGFCHTGDVGYYDEDGMFYIVGRIKEIIKYKGFQVSPSELETLIITHPEVKDCGVIGIPNERAGEVPLAYVVKQNDAELTEEEIAQYVSIKTSKEKHLYGGVRFIDEIPKTPSGKILRRKLMDIYQKSQC